MTCDPLFGRAKRTGWWSHSLGTPGALRQLLSATRYNEVFFFAFQKPFEASKFWGPP